MYSPRVVIVEWGLAGGGVVVMVMLSFLEMALVNFSTWGSFSALFCWMGSWFKLWSHGVVLVIVVDRVVLVVLVFVVVGLVFIVFCRGCLCRCRNSTQSTGDLNTRIPQTSPPWWCLLPLLRRGIYGYAQSDMGNLFQRGRARARLKL